MESQILCAALVWETKNNTNQAVTEQVAIWRGHVNRIDQNAPNGMKICFMQTLFQPTRHLK